MPFRSAIRTIAICCYLWASLVLTGRALAQSPLNPSFETTIGGACQYNIPNATFSANMSNCTGYGVASQMDIINTSCGFGTAQSGSYFVALAIDITNTLNDGFTMTLTAPLVMGNSYTLTYYDRKDPGYATNVMQVGISTTAGAFGTLIYSSPLPSSGIWTLRTVNFVAPNNGQYLSMRTVAGVYGWNHVDNFQITPVLPVDELLFTGSAFSDNHDLLRWSLPEGSSWQPMEIQCMKDNGEFEIVSYLGEDESEIALEVLQPVTHRYRMKLRGMDGEEQYSQLVEIAREAAGDAVTLVCSPNPTPGQICIQASTPPSPGGEGIIRIMDLNGRLLQETPADPSGTTFLDLAPHGNGLRLIQLKHPDGTSHFSKVLVQD